MFEKYAAPYFKRNDRVLEIGPDADPSTYRQIIADGSIGWKTLDLRSYSYCTRNLTYAVEDEYAYPLADSLCDIVISGNVIEHVKKPWLWIREVARVCKAGGHVITISPISIGYHAYPVDCWRIYPDGMRVLYEDAGLDINLAVFESLESEPHPGLYYLAKQVLKPLFGLRPLYPVPPTVDVIAIGLKPRGPSCLRP
jgi:SAM-dependent methyltransferase